MERDDTLYEEAGFGSRLEALDAIEFSILERVEGLLAANSQEEALLALKAACRGGAEPAGSNRREAVSPTARRHQVWRLRGTELRRRLEAYAGSGRGKRSQSGGAYDSLDALLSGILLAEAAPGEATERESEMVFYQPTPARIIFELVERAAFQQHDTFYDLGSGLGQVVILVSLLSGVTAKGIEFDPAYCEYARRCAQELNLSGVDFINVDAREAEYADGTVFFLYTPFEGRMLQDVLERLKAEAQKRGIGVYTYGPCTQEVSRQDWLESVDQNDHHINRLAVFRSVRGEH